MDARGVNDLAPLHLRHLLAVSEQTNPAQELLVDWNLGQKSPGCISYLTQSEVEKVEQKVKALSSVAYHLIQFALFLHFLIFFLLSENVLLRCRSSLSLLLLSQLVLEVGDLVGRGDHEQSLLEIKLVLGQRELHHLFRARELPDKRSESLQALAQLFVRVLRHRWLCILLHFQLEDVFKTEHYFGRNMSSGGLQTFESTVFDRLEVLIEVLAPEQQTQLVAWVLFWEELPDLFLEVSNLGR